MVYNSDGVIVLKDRQTKLSIFSKKEMYGYQLLLIGQNKWAETNN